MSGTKTLRRYTVSLAVLVLVASAAPALGRERSKPGPAQSSAFRELVDCRKLTDDAARLACYDGKVSALEQAQQAGDLVVADRETMRETRRGLFGFRLPNLGIFGDKGTGAKQAAADDIEQIESTVAAARQFAYGSWRITLADGAVWEQTDSERLPLDPRAGNAITIKRAALGNFKARINGQPPIKVRRVN